MRVSLGQKLTLSFLLVALLVGLLGFVAYAKMGEAAKRVENITDVEVPALVKLAEMKTYVLENVEEAFAYPLLDDPLEKAEFYSNLERFDAVAGEFKEIAHLGQRGQEEETELFNQIVIARGALALAAGKMFDSYERDGPIDLSDVAAFEDEIDIVIPHIDAFLEIEGEEVVEAHEDIHATFANAKRLTLFLVSVATLLAIGLGVLVSRSISIPINKLRDAASRVGRGELDTEIEIKSKDEIGDLGRSFSKMAQQVADRTRELSRSNEELQQFASVASHDLQEPLRKVSAFGDLLEASESDRMTEQGRDYLRRMQDAAARMKTLINDLLTLSRVTTKAQPFVVVDLAKVTSEVVTDLEVRIGETGGRVDVTDMPTIDADRTQMRQLLQNLIGNGLKFHRPGQPPVVRVRGYLLDGQANGDNGAHPGKEMLRLTEEDNGIGFDETYLDRIFTVFQRLHGRDEYEGSGVGLAVCRKIVERHAGTITATSEPGRGSTFVATLPVNHRPIGHRGR